KRASQQILQGFRLAPSAGLDRLHDTGLKPTHDAVGRRPVDGMPALLHVGGRTSSVDVCRHLLAPSSGSPGFLVTKDPREVGPLSRGVISPKGSTPIRPITGRPSLPPSSSTRRPIGDRLTAGPPPADASTPTPRPRPLMRGETPGESP